MAEDAADQRFEGFPDRPALRRALRRALGQAMPELRMIAEGFLAEVSAMDLLAVGGEGELVSIRHAEPGDGGAALTRSLADLSWLRPRRSDFLKLAPGLGIEPSAEPRAVLVAGEVGAETRAAVENFPTTTVQLWRCRGLQRDGIAALWVEPLDERATPRSSAQADASQPAPSTDSSPSRSRAVLPRRAPRPDRMRPPTDPPSHSAFRTGLADADLEPGGGAESEGARRSRAEPSRTPTII